VLFTKFHFVVEDVQRQPEFLAALCYLLITSSCSYW